MTSPPGLCSHKCKVRAYLSAARTGTAEPCEQGLTPCLSFLEMNLCITNLLDEYNELTNHAKARKLSGQDVSPSRGAMVFAAGADTA